VVGFVAAYESVFKERRKKENKRLWRKPGAGEENE